MPVVERWIKIKASREKIWSILIDMENYSRFMPDVEEVKILARDGVEPITFLTTAWTTSVEGTPIMWTEQDTFFHEQFRVEYKLVEGDLDKFEGYWEIRELRDGQRELTLLVDYDFGIPELTNLIGPTLLEKVGENSQMMLEGIKHQAEALAATA